jgi:Type IV secretion system pilin
MIRRLFLATILMTLCLVAAPSSTMAFDPFGGVCSNGNAHSSILCTSSPPTDSNGKPQDPLNTTLASITDIVAYVAGAAAIIVLIISALRLITSGSDVSTGSRTDTDVEDARRSIAGAVIGLIIIVLTRTIIFYLLGRL